MKAPAVDPSFSLPLIATMLALLLAGGPGVASGQSVEDYAVRLSALVQTNPARITLSWPEDPRATRYTLYKKSRDATVWGSPIPLATNATTYADSGVTLGTGYEYRVVKVATNVAAATNYIGEGYLYAGFGIPLADNRGKVILVVDSSVASALAFELARLQQDLLGDGWTVVRRDVARTDSVSAIRTLIRNDYNSDATRVKAVFLFGHVPVPYSGDYNPDGHPDHKGAWPADGYYGDMDGNWTDVAVNNSTASDPRNRNVPGDGKFDQSQYPSSLELQVGRVDLANLPAFGVSEVELLRRYLNKNHAFRHKVFSLEPRGLIDDHFGVFGGEAFAVSGWRNFSGFFGVSGTTAGDWLSTLGTQGYLWGYGCGAGSYNSANGVASTELLAGSDPRVVFTLLFGSYFGDWDSRDNLLRAALATPGYTLTSGWAGRPHWAVHHMALGETIGFSTRVTQNNSGLYAANGASRLVALGLMGDPTLRMHTVGPPSGLIMRTNGAGGMLMSWVPSPGPVQGYAIYRSSTGAGPYSRVNPQLATSNSFTATPVNTGVYMVRAVRLEETSSGTYYNLSQGAFQDLAGNFGPPTLSVQRRGDTISLTWPAKMVGYHLEGTESLVSGVWSPMSGPAQVSNDLNVITRRIEGAERFFRLREP